MSLPGYGDSVSARINRVETAHWSLSIYPAAREAGGTFVPMLPYRRGGGLKGFAVDPERSSFEAARRAKGRLRRYCAANRLNRLGTLTYRGEGCHDQQVLRADVAEFFRQLRDALGGEAFAYIWVPEWHPGGHGLHVHFAVGQFIQRSLIESSWPHGFVHIKLLGDLPVGSGALGEARSAADYLSKYVAKSFADPLRLDGLHRYDLAQGFKPKVERIIGNSRDAVIDLASEGFGAEPLLRWSSDDVLDWRGGPAIWVQWP